VKIYLIIDVVVTSPGVSASHRLLVAKGQRRKEKGGVAMIEHETIDLDTGKIKEWRSIVTLLVFIITSKSRMSYHIRVSSTNQRLATFQI
jgi:hypothetical protein